jgi:hypothetical protein
VSRYSRRPEGELLEDEHQRVLLYVSCCQERYRLTGRIAGSLALSPVFLAAGMLDRGDAALGDAHARSYFGLDNACVSRGGVEHLTRASMVTIWLCTTAPRSFTASPIYRFGEQVVAAISVTGPVYRLDPDRYAPTVRLAALALSRRLGRLSAAPAAGSGRGILAR